MTKSSKKTLNLKTSLNDSENFASEYQESVGKLRPPEQNADQKESSLNYQASFLKSCATRSLNFLNQASLKIKFGNSKSPSSKGHSPTFDKEIENSDLKPDEKIEVQPYDKLVVFLTRKKWEQKLNGNLVM